MQHISDTEDLATFKWMQEAELKHARVAMLATVLWPLSELDHSALKLPYLDLSGSVSSVRLVGTPGRVASAVSQAQRAQRRLRWA